MTLSASRLGLSSFTYNSHHFHHQETVRRVQSETGSGNAVRMCSHHNLSHDHPANHHTRARCVESDYAECIVQQLYEELDKDGCFAEGGDEAGARNNCCPCETVPSTSSQNPTSRGSSAVAAKGNIRKNDVLTGASGTSNTCITTSEVLLGKPSPSWSQFPSCNPSYRRQDESKIPRPNHTLSRTRRSRSSASGWDGGLCYPVSGEEALKLYANKLTEWEQSEITQFRTVYYLGHMAPKKVVQELGKKNNGFDDSEGFYICKPQDHIMYRYEIQDFLGRGTFGQVVRAIDHKNHNLVAVKIVRNERPFLRQAHEEIRILEVLKKQDTMDLLNIVHMLENFSFRGHICIAFELLGINLHQLLKKTRGRGFSLSKVQRLSRAILKCLETLHKNKIVHCDLKPENILLRRSPPDCGSLTDIISDTSIKVIDFGSSCYEHQQTYSYIQSRFYRAPEVMLGARYGCPIDIWSLACVLGESLTTEPIFAGNSEADQLACIMEVRGLPSRCLLDRCKRANNFFTPEGQPRIMTKRNPPMSISFSSLLGNCEDAVFLDFMKKALTWDPTNRLTASEALQHPWLMPPTASNKSVSGTNQLTSLSLTVSHKVKLHERPTPGECRLPGDRNTNNFAKSVAKDVLNKSLSHGPRNGSDFSSKSTTLII